MTRDEFYVACAAYLNAKFDTKSTEPEWAEFSRLLKYGVEGLSYSLSALSYHIEVAPSVIQRWILDEGVPLPAFRREIVRLMMTKSKEDMPNSIYRPKAKNSEDK